METVVNMIFQFEIDYLLTPFLVFIILFILMVIMVYLYSKMRVFLPILVVFLFSIAIGITSLSTPNFPFSPYFQTFFIMFQSIFFLLTSKDVVRK